MGSLQRQVAFFFIVSAWLSINPNYFQCVAFKPYRRGTIDSLVRFPADSTLIGPTKEKIGLWPFIFYCLPTQSYLWNYWSHKSRSPIKIYRISFPPTYSNVWTLDSKNKIGSRGFFLFCRPPDSSKKLRDWFGDQWINCPSPNLKLSMYTLIRCHIHLQICVKKKCSWEFGPFTVTKLNKLY